MNHKLLILLFFLIITYYNNAQPSYSTNFSFQLLDKNRQAIDMSTFCKDYEIANVFGDKIETCNEDARQMLMYDEATKYFTVTISTIGPRYSFAIYHKDMVMALYIPFSNSERPYYAVDKLKMKHGAYYLDFDKIKDSISIQNNMYYSIPRVRWGKQRRKFKQSEWKGLESIYELTP